MWIGNGAGLFLQPWSPYGAYYATVVPPNDIIHCTCMYADILLMNRILKISFEDQILHGFQLHYSDTKLVCLSDCWSHEGSKAKRIDSILFLARCCKRWPNRALSVLYLSLDFFSVCLVMFTMLIGCVALFCFFSVFCLLVVLVWLTVPVQVTGWKDSSPKWSQNVLMGKLNHTFSA